MFIHIYDNTRFNIYGDIEKVSISFFLKKKNSISQITYLCFFFSMPALFSLARNLPPFLITNANPFSL